MKSNDESGTETQLDDSGNDGSDGSDDRQSKKSRKSKVHHTSQLLGWT